MSGAGEVYHLFEAIPRQYYRAIVADPPWAYRNKKTGGSMRSGSAAKYHTLSIDELKAIPVSDIAVKDSILFLWECARCTCADTNDTRSQTFPTREHTAKSLV